MLCYVAFIKIGRVKRAKAYFDETIDDFASTKAQEVFFKLEFLCNLPRKGWI